LVATASSVVVATDFDGTLAPIVDDPASARIHPDAADVLAGLAPHVAAIAVVTGRPARQVLALGGLEEVGERIAAVGKELYVFGQYGNERWTSSQRSIRGPLPPPGLASFLRDLPQLLRRADAADAHVEDKGLAVAVHTRRMADPQGTFDRLLPVLAEAASGHDLVTEPGRNVIEVRAGGMDKGVVVDRLVDELGAGGVLFAGDDLGDVDAFESVAAWRKNGLATLLVYSASDEESALAPMADVVVDGPDGVLNLLRDLTSRIAD
jgi:trehalose 6-phosphate phosphatase